MGGAGASAAGGGTDTGGAAGAGGTGGGAGSGGAPGTGGAAGAPGSGGAGGAGGAPPTGYADEVLADAPLAYWRLGEGSGATAFDSSGNGHHGTFEGTPVYGEGGAVAGADTSVRFTGNPCGFAHAEDFDDFVGTDPFSLEAWIRPTQIGTTFRHVFSKDIDDANGRQQYGVFVHADVGLAFERYVDDQDATASALLPPLNVWTHFVATYDGASLRIYTNGTLGETRTDARSSPPKDVISYFGTKAPSQGCFLGGLDEVAIYGTTLSAARISAHYTAGIGGS
jgi:hypothetical protein